MIAQGLRGLETVFGWLLEASWQAAVLAILVLFVQRLFRTRLNPRWNYLLWLLVVARLVLPVLPESVLSLFQFAPATPPQIVVTVSQLLFIPSLSLGSESAVGATTASEPLFTFYTFLTLGWLAGAVILLIATILTNRRFARQMNHQAGVSDEFLVSLFHGAKNELGVTREVRLVESHCVQSPAVMGLFRPTLLLPQNVKERFSASELRLIFLHELAHLKRGDIVVQWLIAGLQILHWFNPVLWFAFRRMRIDREPATDALVLSRAGEEQKVHYGEMLIKQLEHFNQRHSIPTLVGILEDKDQFKHRFSLIARFTKGAYGWSLLGFALVIILSGVCLTQSKKPSVSADERLMEQLRAAAKKGDTAEMEKILKPPTTSNPKVIPELPPQPTKQQVQEYVQKVLGDVSVFANSSLKDIEIKQLKRVGADNIDILIAEDGKHQIFGVKNPTTNYYLSMAICDLARPQDKQIILDALPKNRYLVYTILKMGWSIDAREELLRVFRQEPGKFAPGWIEAIASLHDPSTYEELKAYLVHGEHREHTYNALKQIPDIGDLRPWVEKAWELAKKDVVAYEVRDMAKIAAQYGIEDAIIYLKRNEESQDTSNANTTTTAIPQQIEIISRIFSLDRDQLQKLVSVSDERLNAPAKELFGNLLKVNTGGRIGVLDDKDVSQLIGAIDSTPGIDLLSAPKVTAKSGTKARVEVVREFRYPTEFTPDGNRAETFVPSKFETKNIGITIDVTPTIAPKSATTIDLQAAVELCDLVGWRRIKDGSYLDPKMRVDLNTIFITAQPVFNIRRIDTKFFIPTGRTLLLRLHKGDVEKPLVDSKEFEFVLLTASLVKAE